MATEKKPTKAKKESISKDDAVLSEEVSSVKEEAKTPAAKEGKVTYTMSGGFVGFLESIKSSLALTSYQSSKLYLLGKNPKGGLMVNEQIFPRAMGISYNDQKLYLSSAGQIIKLENILKPGQWINETFTECFVPRTSHFIGDVDCHDVGLNKNGDLIFVSTKYNCIATTSAVHSFKQVWRPDFISKLVAEDRCHLNGMALENGEVKYVTAICRSDTIDGWRDRRSSGGIVIDALTNKIVCEGLSMPHSPRLHLGKLWVLNSGSGELGWVNLATNKFELVAFCPGFLRGLAFHGNYAFVGLSRPRYDRFEGLPLDKKLVNVDSEPWTGIQVIDINTGACVHWFRIDGPVAELYDVTLLPKVTCAKSIAFATPEAQTLITIED